MWGSILFISGQEMVIVFIIVLLLFGSKGIPEVAKGIGKGLREFKKATDEIKTELKDSSSGVMDQINEIKRDIESDTREVVNTIKKDIETGTDTENYNNSDYNTDAEPDVKKQVNSKPDVQVDEGTGLYTD
jgi:sec-independent protein translocase protein TatA